MLPDQSYHIYNHANGSENIFREEENYRFFLHQYEKYLSAVSKQFSNFFSSYTQSFNKVYTRKGSLFIKNFKRKPILTECQWQDTFLYIHLNPIKHGFVKDLRNWKWSSFHGYESAKNPSKLERSYYLNYFDSWQHANYLMNIKKEAIMKEEME